MLPLIDSPLGTDNSPEIMNLQWFVKLRWGLALGQVLAMFTCLYILAIALPLLPLVIVLSGTVLSNIGAMWFAGRQIKAPPHFLGTLIVLDAVILSSLLYLTGGPANPFNFFFLVHLALASIFLQPKWSWALVGLYSVSFALFFLHRYPATINDSTLAQPYLDQLQPYGMWFAFTLAACFITYFVQRTSSALRHRETALAFVRDRQQRHEKITALATLSAGAAHELATPLSTVAVVAKDLMRHIQSSPPNLERFREDTELIGAQVQRCKKILAQMAGKTGDVIGESMIMVGVEDLIDEVLAPFANHVRAHIADLETADQKLLYIPFNATCIALRSIVKNAVQANAGGTTPVSINIYEHNNAWHFAIEDVGGGMDPETLRRIGEPFFTTKSPGQGSGLGIFLARTVIENLHGSLDYNSSVGKGTKVIVRIPLSVQQ